MLKDRVDLLNYIKELESERGQLILKLQELKSYLWLETGSMVYSKRLDIQDRINEIIERLDDTDIEDTPDIMDMGLNELSIGED
jgi:hypothetical protein